MLLTLVERETLAVCKEMSWERTIMIDQAEFMMLLEAEMHHGLRRPPDNLGTGTSGRLPPLRRVEKRPGQRM